MDKISLLHPSRNRPEKAYKAIKQWLDSSSKEYAIEYILSLDNDEPQLDAYFNYIQQLEHEYPMIEIHHIRGVSDFCVAATNRAANVASGDIFVFMADDFESPDNWDKDIVQIINRTAEGKRKFGYANNDLVAINNSSKVALLVDDNCNKNYNVLTLPVITKYFYLENGYFFHPSFKSMFCDNFMYEQATRKGYLVDARHLIFTHRHFSNVNESLRSELDDTYIRTNGLYDEGRKIFNNLAEIEGWDIRY